MISSMLMHMVLPGYSKVKGKINRGEADMYTRFYGIDPHKQYTIFSALL